MKSEEEFRVEYTKKARNFLRTALDDEGYEYTASDKARCVLAYQIQELVRVIEDNTAEGLLYLKQIRNALKELKPEKDET